MWVWAAIVDAALPRTNACVASENAVAQITNVIARRPARSCTRAHQSPWRLASSGQRGAGDEPGDAREGVQREHEAVAQQDLPDGAEALRLVDAREQQPARVGRGDGGDDPHGRQQRGGDRGAAQRPGADDGSRVAVPARERAARVVHSLDEGEVLCRHVEKDRRVCGGYLNRRSSGISQNASPAIRHDIFDCPCRRSRKTIGTSATRKPRCTAR